jgi:hypothetical protein
MRKVGETDWVNRAKRVVCVDFTVPPTALLGNFNFRVFIKTPFLSCTCTNALPRGERMDLCLYDIHERALKAMFLETSSS